MPIDNRGTLSRLGNIMQVNNALVEEVFLRTNNTGHILVSYMDSNPNAARPIRYLRLNVGNNTAILNLTGRNTCLCDIRRGMWIDAIVSPNFTFSIPPQANAFLILVRRNPRPSPNITTGRILSVNPAIQSFLIGTPGDRNRQTRFNVTNNTRIRDRFGNPIRLAALRPGDTVRVIHADFMTASIPPQTTAFYVQVI